MLTYIMKDRFFKKEKFINIFKVFLLFIIVLFDCCAMNEREMNELKWQVYSIINSSDMQEKDKIQTIQKILNRGFDINYNLWGGFTALHFAVLRNHIHVCNFLIANGANPHIENCDDNTTYYLADKKEFNVEYKLTDILRQSQCTIFRPGMNSSSQSERYKMHSLEMYNKIYNLNLTMGPIFQ